MNPAKKPKNEKVGKKSFSFPLRKMELWPVAKLKPYARNARTHSDEQVSQIAASITEFGFTNPILVDDAAGIVAGHGRLLAAQKLGLDKVPVIVLTGLTDVQRRAYIIADNKLALNAGWDFDVLAAELDILRDVDFDLSLLGFEPSELNDLIGTPNDAPGLTDEDVAPEAPAKATSKRGDVWILGPHRVMCGDSTSAPDVEKLMAGKKADMIFTDPPYGIAYSSDKFNGNKAGVTNKRNKAAMIIGDDKPFDPSFLLAMFKRTKEVFVWGYQYYPEKLGRGGIIVWNKKQESEADCPHGDFEICWSKNERNKMLWLKWGGFNNKEKNEKRLHTTQKPVALAEWFFEKFGNGVSIVADLFGGSGSTLIACEKTGRINRSMEIDPKYCDVIVRRWQEYTGKKAMLESTGKMFDGKK